MMRHDPDFQRQLQIALAGFALPIKYTGGILLVIF